MYMRPCAKIARGAGVSVVLGCQEAADEGSGVAESEAKSGKPRRGTTLPGGQNMRNAGKKPISRRRMGIRGRFAKGNTRNQRGHRKSYCLYHFR